MLPLLDIFSKHLKNPQYIYGLIDPRDNQIKYIGKNKPK